MLLLQPSPPRRQVRMRPRVREIRMIDAVEEEEGEEEQRESGADSKHARDTLLEAKSSGSAPLI